MHCSLCVPGFDFILFVALIHSHCTLFIVFEHGVFFFLVSSSILLLMVVQHLVEILELLQERWVHAILLHHLELRSDSWQYFYGFNSWNNRNKNNSKQIRCNWTWKLLHIKGSHKQTTTTTKCPTEGEKKFPNDETLNKLISKRYK